MGGHLKRKIIEQIILRFITLFFLFSEDTKNHFDLKLKSVSTPLTLIGLKSRQISMFYHKEYISKFAHKLLVYGLKPGEEISRSTKNRFKIFFKM
jgi:hypothetical protein